MTYLLDTMIVSYFLQAGCEADLANAAKRCPMALVGEVRKELNSDKKRGGKPFLKWLATSGINERAIEIGSPEHDTLVALVDPLANAKNLGERASVAVAASDASFTFVTNDTNGQRIALREIWTPGERILGVAVFLRRLFEQGALTDPSTLDDVMAIVLDKVPQHQPTWWASWRAALAAAKSLPPMAIDATSAQLDS